MMIFLIFFHFLKQKLYFPKLIRPFSGNKLLPSFLLCPYRWYLQDVPSSQDVPASQAHLPSRRLSSQAWFPAWQTFLSSVFSSCFKSLFSHGWVAFVTAAITRKCPILSAVFFFLAEEFNIKGVYYSAFQ